MADLRRRIESLEDDREEADVEAIGFEIEDAVEFDEDAPEYRGEDPTSPTLCNAAKEMSCENIAGHSVGTGGGSGCLGPCA